MAILSCNIYTDILVLILAPLGAIILYYKWAFYYWKRKGVDHMIPSIPFGNATKMVRRKVTFGALFKEIYDKYKPQGLRYLGFYLFAKPTLIIFDLSLIKAILTSDFHHFTDHGNYINEKNEPLTGNLFALKGHKWRNLRAKLTPTFTSGKMKMMFHTLVNCSKGFEEVMDEMAKQQKPVDIKDVVARFTTDVIGSCAFGLDCNSLKDPNSEFRVFGKKIFDISPFQGFVRFLSLAFPKIVDFFRLRFISKDVNDFIMNVVRGTVKYREDNNVKRNDFMHLLIQLKNNVSIKEDEHIDHLKSDETSNGDGLTIEEIAAQALVFFIAGFETSSTTLSFCFFEIVVNQDVQHTLRNEINTVLKKHGGNITYEAIMEMTYMDKCIQETLRKYPPLPFLMRECTEDYVIPESDITIYKGMEIFLPILGIHRDEEYYPDAETFDPERFDSENKASRDPFTWLPFGEGPRACIGLRFGLMQTKVALTALLKDYEFTLNNKTKTPLVLSGKTIIMAAEGGIWLNAKKI